MKGWTRPTLGYKVDCGWENGRSGLLVINANYFGHWMFISPPIQRPHAQVLYIQDCDQSVKWNVLAKLLPGLLLQIILFFYRCFQIFQFSLKCSVPVSFPLTQATSSVCHDVLRVAKCLVNHDQYIQMWGQIRLANCNWNVNNFHCIFYHGTDFISSDACFSFNCFIFAVMQWHFYIIRTKWLWKNTVTLLSSKRKLFFHLPQTCV